MKRILFRLLVAVMLLSSLAPTVDVFADDDGGYKFYGVIQSLPSGGWFGDWIVGGRTVHVTAATRIEQEHGPIAVGACVEVKGWPSANGSINATKIETQEPYKCPRSGGDGGNNGTYIRFYGLVEYLPAGSFIGTWRVSGRSVIVSAATRVEQQHGPIAVGVCVEVQGRTQTDGSINASKVETQEPYRCGSAGGGSGGGGGGSGSGSGGIYTEFYGTVESLPANGWVGDWTVSGTVVRVNNWTRIEQEHGQVSVGAYVEVKGYQQADGAINATKIEVKMPAGVGGSSGSYVKFYGTIENLPTSGWVGQWTVSGRIVHVDAFTRIEQEYGLIAVGAYVEVKGWGQPDGSVKATKIEVKAGSASGSRSSEAYTKFYGTIEQMPSGTFVGTWLVSGRTVYVDAFTRLYQEHGPATVGAYVEVYGLLQSDGTIKATKIEVKAGPVAGGGSTAAYTKFYGTVEQMPSGTFVGTWLISGRKVQVSAATWVDQRRGRAAVGAYVEVYGLLQADGSVAATKIEVKAGSSPSSSRGRVGYVKFYGVIEDLPPAGWVGDWMINGRVVHVTSATRIKQEHGQVRIGAYVEVKGLRQEDGSVDAYKVEVKR